MSSKIDIKNKIIEFAKINFGKNFSLYLFGSRVDDNKRGGDIDLFIDSDKDIEIQKEISFLKDIFKNVTERKVDLIVKTPSKKYRTIFDTAKQEGIKLC